MSQHSSLSGVYRGVTAEAIALAAAGQAGADAGEGRIAALFNAHHLRLYRLARRLSGDADAARDLVQETFLRAAGAIRSVPPGSSAEEAWLVRVLLNVCRDQWRKRARHSRLAGFAVPWSGAARMAGDSEAAFIAKATVWQALQALPPRRRAAIVMYELEGAAIPDIARLLGVSAVTVRWHLSRGRRELAQAIRGTTI